jgi:hypothetical protein
VPGVARRAKTGETSLPIHMSNSLRPSARHASAISRRPAPELCCIVPPSMMRGRREGRASADAHGPRAAKSTRQNHRCSQHPAFPAQWFDGLYVLSPGTGSLAPVARMLVISRRLDLSAGRPGPHDFAVRSPSVVAQKRLMTHGHRIPASHAVTIAKRPSR